MKEIDNHHHEKMPCKPERLLTMPRTGPRDLANQALRYGTIKQGRDTAGRRGFIKRWSSDGYSKTLLHIFGSLQDNHVCPYL